MENLMGRRDKPISSEKSAILAIGEQLRCIRQEKGLSLTEMAKLLGYTKGYLSGVENGHVLPSQELLKSYEQKLGFEPDELNKQLQTQSPTVFVEPLPSLRNVPYLRNPFFTGRKDTLERIHTVLHTTKQVPSICAISGLGGIGKTQVAIEYLYRNRSNYQAIFWLKADSYETLASNLAGLADVLNLPGKDTLDRERAIAEVKNWLKEHTRYLIIIDGLDDLKDIGAIYSFISQVNGHVLLTSRVHGLMQEIPSVLLDKMTLEESALFLLRRIEIISFDSLLTDALESEYSNAQKISESLDGLPLAIEQAGAFIKETGCSLSDYLDLYQAHCIDLLQQQGELTAGYNKAVATTWSLSFEKIESVNSIAANILRLCAFLYPIIPEEVITRGTAKLESPFEAIADNLLKANTAIGELVKYSFLRRSPNNKTLTIHRLVQIVLQERMIQEDRNTWGTKAYIVVNNAFPFGGDFSVRRSRYYHVEAFLRYSLSMQEQLQGPEHLNVAERSADLAELYRVRADFIQAEALFLRALDVQRKVLGTDHSLVATNFNRLARLYRAKGDYAKAELYYQQAINIQEHILEFEHPEVAESLRGLAKLCQTLGKYDRAETLCKRALNIQEKRLPSDHPDIAHTLTILAEVYRSREEYAKAELFCQRALDIWQRKLDVEDPLVALGLSKQAEVFLDQGKYSQAESLLKRSLEIREKVLDKDHPYIAFNLDDLGTIYSGTGEYDLAESMYKRALTIREQKLGPNHMYVAITHNNLGKLYFILERYGLAEIHYKRALEIRKQDLDLEHSDVKVVIENYITLLNKLGRFVDSDKLKKLNSN
jgi:tetratricopeptide (TPR) repeat protein